MSDLHFSPRPHRAHEIDWQPWGAQAFERAAAQDKPVLLAISAVWCHWCHVMDETSYSTPEIIGYINEHYVPVRVDNDRRPDVNARYNQGGWPTTAFLTPDGALLAGATYLPPDRMYAALQQIAEFYAGNRAQIAERSQQLRAQQSAAPQAVHAELGEAAIAAILDAAERRYDEAYGGFGTEPKFPMTGLLEFLLQEYRVTRSQRVYDMLARTLLAMSGGGTYDHVEGGFFRYSTTRDWSVPHFEKMSEDHAALLRILAVLTRETRNAQFRETLLSAAGYVRDVLHDPQTGFFAGSQDADEAYYAMPLEERRKTAAPYVDRTVYANWNAGLAAAFVAAGAALEDDALLDAGCATLDALHERMRDSDGLLFHFAVPGSPPEARGLLTDQAAYLRALLDAHEYTGAQRFLDRARESAGLIQRFFACEDGGFSDRAPLEESIGNLSMRDRPLPENCSIAESLLRLGTLLEEPSYREPAQEALRVYAAAFERAGIFAAPFGRALRRLIARESSLFIAGTPEQTRELREAAHRLPDPLLCIRTGAPEAGREAGRGYLCAAGACAAPAADAAQLREAYEQLRAAPA